MRKYILVLFFGAFIGTVAAQTVENIQVEQDGEKLNINYRIGGSTSDQLYFVTLTCSIDGGPVFEPKSVIGDVGANIRGGKSFNTVVWNVFNDVEEVGNVEFFVKVDLTQDNGVSDNKSDASNPVSKKNQKGTSNYKNIFIAYSGNFNHPVGAKIGYANNWGVFGTLRYGNDYYYDEFNYNWDEYYYYVEIVGGISKKLVHINKFRLHGYGGVGIGVASYDYYDYLDSSNDYYYADSYATFDIGAMAMFGRLMLDLGLTLNNYYYVDLNFGIGFVF